MVITVTVAWGPTSYDRLKSLAERCNPPRRDKLAEEMMMALVTGALSAEKGRRRTIEVEASHFAALVHTARIT